MVAALKALCDREGGHKVVAEEARVSADNLWQILAGIELPSGNPRGIGPGLRQKLTKRYPDWLAAVETAAMIDAVWPFKTFTPTQYAKLGKAIKGEVEERLLGAITMMERKQDDAPVGRVVHAKQTARSGG